MSHHRGPGNLPPGALPPASPPPQIPVDAHIPVGSSRPPAAPVPAPAPNAPRQPTPDSHDVHSPRSLHIHRPHIRPHHAPPPPPPPPPPPAPPFPGYEDYEFFRVTAPAAFVAHVEINNPAKHNAFSEPIWLEFGAIFRRLSRDQDVRAVVLSGAGERAFTSGLDVKAAASGPLARMDASDVARSAAVLRGQIGEFQDCISAMDVVGKPVIAAVHGLCYGLGVDIACCADIRFCTADVRFAVKEVDIGMAADVGSLARLPKIVGNQSWVREVCFTARDFGAGEAHHVGFVSRVCADKAEVLREAIGLAEAVAEKSPVAVQGTKEILLHARDHSVEDNLRFTAVWNGAALQSADFKSSILSSFSKRKVKYEKL
ncbi:hypothetical protein TD95_005294 [Thielaviopsis punctulata]|uniref:Enoyl-CoA hydratase n=1 Tax=Thielaviopsis punctulata TaxID=72032 RepID=A0A0F4ZKT6_9PEZI|nr:hypothetical protein TD95_005294 [Thielaviopsis punctulata]